MAKKIKAYFLLFILLMIVSLFGLPQKSAILAENLATADQETILVKYQDNEDIITVQLNPGQTINQALEVYNTSPLVDYAEPNYLYQAASIPNDPFYNNQWYLKRIIADQAWEIADSSPDIIIAVLDSGLQIEHPDLKNNIWTNDREMPDNGLDDDNNGYIDDYQGYDFVNRVPDPSPKFKLGFTEDGVTHGTIIAGILGAQGNNGKGISGLTWQSQIMPLKVLDDRGQTDSGKVIEAINYAVAQGAHIINMSFVGYGNSRGLQQAIRRAHQAGVILVAAGGNDQGDGFGRSLDTDPMYPVCHDDGDNLVVGVGATGPIDQKASFSSYGRCIDIVAPGVSFYSTVPVTDKYLINNKVFDKYYDGYWSGTSFAVPLVSGTLALMLQSNPGLRPHQAVDLLLASTDNIDRLNPDYLGRLGRGRLNMATALTAATKQLDTLTQGLVISQGNEVQIYNFGKELISAFKVPGWKKINLASADFNGDGQAEIIVSPQGNAESKVRIYNLKGDLQAEWLAYPKTFFNGLQVATGDVNNDGQIEIITGPGAGFKPEIKIFNQQGKLLKSFLAYAGTFGGGVNLAVGDVDNNGQAEIVTAPFSKGGPHIRRFDYQGKLLSQFFALTENYRNSYVIAITTAYNNQGKNQARIVVAAGPGLSPEARIFDVTGQLVWKIGAYSSQNDWGVNLASGDINSDGQGEIITIPRQNKQPLVNVYNYRGLLLETLELPNETTASDFSLTTINL